LGRQEIKMGQEIALLNSDDTFSAQQGTNGAAHVASNVFDVSQTPTITTLSGGSHSSAAVTAGTMYRVDSDVNVHLLSSLTSSVYGATLDASSDGYRTASVDLSTNTELDFLDTTSAGMVCQFWGSITSDIASLHRVITFGQASGEFLDFQINQDSGGNWKVIASVYESGVQVINAQGVTSTAHDSNEHMFTFLLDRSATRFAVYVDKVKIHDDTGITDTGAGLNLSTTGQRLGIGVTNGGAALFGGTMWDLQLYNTALTEAQIFARVDAGIPTSVSDLVQDTISGANLKYWISFQNYSSWATATEPEPMSGYGDTTIPFAVVGTPTLGLKTGGSQATTTNSSRVLAGVPEVIKTGATDTFLNMYSSGGSSGDVRLTKI